MSDQPRESLARRAGSAVSRRQSLLSLGATAFVAAVAHPAPAAARKGGKKTKNLKTKKCRKQVGQCSTFLAGVCLGDPVCESAITCCGLFTNCNAAAALPCIFLN